MGKLATQSYDAKVRDFGRKLESDHTAHAGEIERLLEPLDVTIPTEPSAEALAQIAALTRLSGEAFDSAFIQMAIWTHTDALETYGAQTHANPDRSLHDFATKSLPMLREHLAQAGGRLAVDGFGYHETPATVRIYEPPPGVHRQHDLASPEPADGVCRGQNRLVLDGRDRDAHLRPTVPRGVSCAQDAQVVGLRAARREDHLARLGADGLRHLAARQLHPGPCRPAEAVPARGVAESLLGEIGKHGLEDFGANRRRRRVIEVDRGRERHGGESKGSRATGHGLPESGTDAARNLGLATRDPRLATHMLLTPSATTFSIAIVSWVKYGSPYRTRIREP